jgi:hypothetical protein
LADVGVICGEWTWNETRFHSLSKENVAEPALILAKGFLYAVGSRDLDYRRGAGAILRTQPTLIGCPEPAKQKGAPSGRA